MVLVILLLCKDHFWYIPKLWMNLSLDSSGWLLLWGKNNKQTRFCSIATAHLMKYEGRVFFILGWSIYMKNIIPAMPRSWPQTSGIFPCWDGIKIVPASYKRNNKLVKKWLYSSDFVHCRVPFIISSQLSYKQPLRWMFKMSISMINWFKR